MRGKIKNSLSAKVFLWVLLALTICSAVTYGIVMAVIPKHYQIISDERLSENIEALTARLNRNTYEDAVKIIFDFCLKNNCAATLTDGYETTNFGKLEGDTGGTATSSYAVNIYLDGEQEYLLILSSVSQVSRDISGTFLKVLPAIAGVIIGISVFSAWICSKVIVTPIVHISRIAGRMRKLDMTWHCEVKSSDEIGLLAQSLNVMADRLKRSMDEYRNFFAAVSHELKTPLTILKGQLENMIDGYGDYKNHDKYLPQALTAAENIEHLVLEILSISKMENMDIESTAKNTSLSVMIDSVVRDIHPMADEKQIKIDMKMLPEGGKKTMVYVQEKLFCKALSNIIGNAVRYSPNGETVHIIVDCNQCLLMVRNTGVTISGDDLQYMFKPFYRTDKSRSRTTGGSGLGLYIVKTVLDLHDMKYWIESGDDDVTFYLKF